MPRVSVVIPNWNGLEHLEECFGALAAQTFREFETIMVDNASGDASVQWMYDHAPRAHVIERSDNGGFAKAVNVGIRASASEYVALLNNDTLADPEWLAELVRVLDERGDYDFAASLMVFYDDPHTVNAAGDTYSLRFATACNRGFERPVEGYLVPGRVLGACAGAALYRRSLFEDIGLFDEDFFLIHEDSDLNLRALLAGKRCIYVPTARVLHKHGASIRSAPSHEMEQLALRNQALVLAKDLPPLLVLAAWPMWLWRAARDTVLVKPKLLPTAWSRLGPIPDRFRSYALGFRMGLRKRSGIRALRRVGDREVYRWLRRGFEPLEPTDGAGGRA